MASNNHAPVYAAKFYPGGHQGVVPPDVGSPGSEANNTLRALHRALGQRTPPTDKNGVALAPTMAEVSAAQSCGCPACLGFLHGLQRGASGGVQIARQQMRQQQQSAAPRQRSAAAPASMARTSSGGAMMPEVVRRGGRAMHSAAATPAPKTYRLATALGGLNLTAEADRAKARQVITRVVTQHVSEHTQPRPGEDNRQFVARRARAIGRGELRARRAFGV